MWLCRRHCAAPRVTMLAGLSRSSEPSNSQSTTTLCLTLSHGLSRWWGNMGMRYRWEKTNIWQLWDNILENCCCYFANENVMCSKCKLQPPMYFQGLCDGSVADAGVSGGESSRMSEKQRPYGSTHQVHFNLWVKKLVTHYCISKCNHFVSQDVLTRLCDKRQTDEPKEYGPVEFPRSRICRPFVTTPPALLFSSQEVWRVWPAFEWPSSQCNSGPHTGKTRRYYFRSMN